MPLSFPKKFDDLQYWVGILSSNCFDQNCNELSIFLVVFLSSPSTLDIHQSKKLNWNITSVYFGRCKGVFYIIRKLSSSLDIAL